MHHSDSGSLDVTELSPGSQVPAMGDSITEGTVVAFLKQEGEYAAEDEVVVQIETDKVTLFSRHSIFLRVYSSICAV